MNACLFISLPGDARIPSQLPAVKQSGFAYSWPGPIRVESLQGKPRRIAAVLLGMPLPSIGPANSE
jgi:hypothetical protein